MNDRPKNTEIEKAILSLFVDFKDKQDFIVSTVKPEWFDNHIHRNIFIKSKEFYLKNKYLDPLSLDSFLSENDRNYIIGLLNKIPSGEYVHGYAQTLESVYFSRKLFKIGQAIVQKASSMDYYELKLNIENELSNVESNDKSNLKRLSEIIDENSTEEAYNILSESVLKTNMQSFNDTIRIKKDDLIILAGRPSTGKTAFMLHLAKDFAKNDHKVGIFSLEMRGEYLLKRLAHSESFDYGYQGFREGCEKLVNLEIYIDDCPKYDLGKLKEKINIMKTKYGVDVVMLDYLSLLTGPRAENRNQEVSKISITLKQYAREFVNPFLILSQLSREVEKRGGKKPQLSDLRESGQIEQDADIVMFTYRPYIYDIKIPNIEDSQQQYYFELLIRKQRDGQVGNLKFHYNTDNQRFSLWDNVHKENVPPIQSYYDPEKESPF